MPRPPKPASNIAQVEGSGTATVEKVPEKESEPLCAGVG